MVLVQLLLQKLPDVLGLSNWNPQDFEPLLSGWQSVVSFPDDSSLFHQLGHPGQLLDSRRGHAPAVPHLRFPMVHPDVCVGEDLFFQNSVDLQHPVWGTCHEHVVKERENFLFALLPLPPLVGCPAHCQFHPPTSTSTGSRRNTVQRGGSDLLALS